VELGAAEHLGGPQAGDHQHPQEAVRYNPAIAPETTISSPNPAPPPLRVGILADTVDHPGGIGRYVREVLAACGRRVDVELVVATPARGVPLVERVAGPRLARVVVAPRDDQIGLALWDRHRSGRAFADAGARVVLGCKHLVPRTSLPTVLVVHDVLTITRASENSFAKRVLLPAQFRRSLHDATRLVAVSEATRARLRALDARWAEKCSVVPNGMSATLTTVTPVAPPGLDGRDFALVVGDLSPRKNLAALTALWREAPAGLLLVVVGPDSGTDDTARSELLALERAGRAVWIRGADDPVLRWCYEHARVVLFPTREEGFGLPLLEAMTFHAPVVASEDLALREVAAGAATVTHVDADDRDGWRAAIERAAAQPRAPARPRLPAGALTWDDHTERLLGIARSVATG
jgi:glycosyltransferase involved in cell wall biosynthesis